MKIMHHCRRCLFPVGEMEELPKEAQETMRAMGGMYRPLSWCQACIDWLCIGEKKAVTADELDLQVIK